MAGSRRPNIDYFQHLSKRDARGQVWDREGKKVGFPPTVLQSMHVSLAFAKKCVHKFFLLILIRSYFHGDLEIILEETVNVNKWAAMHNAFLPAEFCR